jgi:hypothetical protein
MNKKLEMLGLLQKKEDILLETQKRLKHYNTLHPWNESTLNVESVEKVLARVNGKIDMLLLDIND